MAIAFTTAGRVAFRVTIQPTQSNLGRFSNAVFNTEARVSHIQRVSSKEWQAVVWLKVTFVPQFENLCAPDNFEFLSTRDLVRGLPKTRGDESV